MWLSVGLLRMAVYLGMFADFSEIAMNAVLFVFLTTL